MQEKRESEMQTLWNCERCRETKSYEEFKGVFKIRGQYCASCRQSPQSNRAYIGARLRFQVFMRDNFTCQYCGQRAPQVELHIDHIIPVAHGGTNEIANVSTACAECNLGKGDLLLEGANDSF